MDLKKAVSKLEQPEAFQEENTDVDLELAHECVERIAAAFRRFLAIDNDGDK